VVNAFIFLFLSIVLLSIFGHTAQYTGWHINFKKHNTFSVFLPYLFDRLLQTALETDDSKPTNQPTNQSMYLIGVALLTVVPLPRFPRKTMRQSKISNEGVSLGSETSLVETHLRCCLVLLRPNQWRN